MDKLISGFIYLFTIFITLLCIKGAEKYYRYREIYPRIKQKSNICLNKGSVCLIMATLVPSILAGVRGNDVGTDVLGYAYTMARQTEVASTFEQLNSIDRTYTEYGYRFFSYVVSRWFPGLGWLLFFTQVFIMIFLVRALFLNRKKVSMTQGMAIFMFMFYHLSLNMMRQTMSMSVLFLAFYYLTEKKYFKYVILALLAFSMHTFAIILALMIFIIWRLRAWYQKAWQKGVVLLACVMLIFSYQFLVRMMSAFLTGSLNRYARYLSEDAGGASIQTMLTSPTFFLILIMFIFSALCIKRKNMQKDDYVHSLFLIMLLAIVLRFMQAYSYALYRMGTYFLFFNILYVPIAVGIKYKISVRQKKYIFFVLLLLYWLFDCMLSGHTSTAIFTFRF